MKNWDDRFWLAAFITASVLFSGFAALFIHLVSRTD